MQAAVKVANALSQEMNLERLLKKIVQVIMASTSAERAFLILEDESTRTLKVLLRNPHHLPTEPECTLVCDMHHTHTHMHAHMHKHQCRACVSYAGR